jgi:hypothetical protein
MQPFAMDPRHISGSRVDLSFLLDPPAGKDGFVTIRDGHLAKPSGERLRLWGVNVTDWSPGSVIIPSKDDAPVYADALARFGINCVRLHFLDLDTPRGIIDASHDDSQHFDQEQLDRLDYWVAELKKRGIYCDLNLVVGRSYKAGDEVHGYDKIGWAKALTYFDPRLIELQKQYAEQILTHVNPYTGTEYRHEPAIAIIEMLNENSLVESWHGGGLRSPDNVPPTQTFDPLPVYYTEMLDRMYQDYIERLGPRQSARLKAQAGIDGASPLPRLDPEEFETAPAERFHTEAAFYMDIERRYFEEMRAFLKETLGVRSLLIGSNDHTYAMSGYPMVWANSVLDILDGHMYWQHPAHNAGQNTPMVNEPLHSMVVRLSRTAMAGKPFTVSEVNHIFPGDWISEGIPILAAYAGLQDWDGVIFYTFEPKRDPEWKAYVGDAFDVSLDPVRLPQIAAGALMFARGDVSAARATVERTYTMEQVRDSLRMPASERPYYTPGFSLSLPLQHKMRIGSLEGPPTELPSAEDTNPIFSDTGELSWHLSQDGQGLVTVDSPRSQALVGFVGADATAVSNLAADVSNEFCAITLSALDAQPITRASRLLLTATARVENTGQQWNEARTEVTEFGGPPSVVEPVSGRIVLRGLEGATAVLAYPLDGAGQPTGEAIHAQNEGGAWEITAGDPVTTWYEIVVSR